MNQLSIFTFKGGRRVRASGTPDRPLFVAADVCAILGIAQPVRALRNHQKDEVTKSHVVDSAGRAQEMLMVTEPGMYRLVMRSNKPEAEEFRLWVFNEVLPAIRKTGAYIPQNADLSEVFEAAAHAIRNGHPS